MDHCKCSSLFNASKASLKLSGLIHWDGEKFVANHPANDDLGFEKYARTKFDHDYGRYICWILLSVGAENLAKAACSLRLQQHQEGHGVDTWLPDI